MTSRFPGEILLKLFSHRFLALARWDFYFIKLRLVNRLTKQSQSIRKFLETRSTPCYLNLGSGPRGKASQSWVNIDGYPDKNVHFLVDVSRPLPFDSETFDGVFSEHVLEHFSYEGGISILKEVFRLLKPDGILRIIVPDAERLVRSYFESPEDLVTYRYGKDGLEGGVTPMETLNCFFRQRYEHQFLYDWKTLEKGLHQAGFTEVVRTSYGNFRSCEGIVLDDGKYSWESLYVEARKDV